MKYLLLMTSAGSILFLGTLLLGAVMGEHMSQACRYRMRLMALFTYFVPWVWLKGLYGAIQIRIPVIGGEAVAAGGKGILDEAAFYAAKKLSVTDSYSEVLNIMGVWLGGAVLVMLVRSGFYFCLKHALLRCARKLEADVPEELVRRLKQELGIKRQVRIVRVTGRNSSLTLGVVKPMVFLQNTANEMELEHILRHEFTHIARGDQLFKVLLQLVCCVYWFNPLIYWFSYSMNKVCEKSCDERVVGGMYPDEREAYAHLVVRSMRKSDKKSKWKIPFANFFISDILNRKFARERVKVIMNTRKRKLWEKVVVACAFAVLLFVDSLTAMAYPQVYSVEEVPTRMLSESAEGLVILNRSESRVSKVADVPVLYDEQLITSNGDILPVLEQTKVLCFHKWEDAEIETHVMKDDGGCDLNVYSCTYCPRCDTIRVGDYLCTITYAKCPHDYQ